MRTTEKKTAKVRFTKGVTVSKNYNSVRYELTVEMDYQVGPNGEGLHKAVTSLEERVEMEVFRLQKKATP